MLATAWEFESPLRHQKKINGLAKSKKFANPFCFTQSFICPHYAPTPGGNLASYLLRQSIQSQCSSFPWSASEWAAASVSVRLALPVMPGTVSRHCSERPQPQVGAARGKAPARSSRTLLSNNSYQMVLTSLRARNRRRVLPGGGTPALLGDPKFSQNFFGLIRWKTGRPCCGGLPVVAMQGGCHA